MLLRNTEELSFPSSLITVHIAPLITYAMNVIHIEVVMCSYVCVSFAYVMSVVNETVALADGMPTAMRAYPYRAHLITRETLQIMLFVRPTRVHGRL